MENEVCQKVSAFDTLATSCPSLLFSMAGNFQKIALGHLPQSLFFGVWPFYTSP